MNILQASFLVCIAQFWIDCTIAEEQSQEVRESPIKKMLNRRFEDHTKEFILKAQQRFEAMEKRRKESNMNTISDPTNISAEIVSSSLPFAARLRRHISSSSSQSDAVRLHTRSSQLLSYLSGRRRP